ncbi:MAG: hypothetical protein A2908_00455 [Candidatus Staskawiczbacteria bacterium RIFCSPLOWO2_01_FULL_38_12b]|uniref:Uncharacterized protein n=1 Tax=Candidatus Staskawiczbacteria bacterium RIFCSPLOWO2_01_FULL_38_12b TaxID=1802214 RepID=A0A1G2IGA2_9BACT|nr:MAG: hypothetical protein A2908_00455 [Candidatus Staskawiczbacteria bacterium RIFCSPLOWO2_01_FULL_38_12b]
MIHLNKVMGTIKALTDSIKSYTIITWSRKITDCSFQEITMLGFQKSYKIEYEEKMRSADSTVITIQNWFGYADTKEIALKWWSKFKENKEKSPGPTHFTLAFISITECP